MFHIFHQPFESRLTDIRGLAAVGDALQCLDSEVLLCFTTHTKLVRIVIRLNLRSWTENHCLHRGAGRSVSAEIGQATRFINESTLHSNGSQIAWKGNRGTIIATNINIHYTSCLLYARHHDKCLKWILQFYSSFSHVYYTIYQKGDCSWKWFQDSILMRRSRLAKYNTRLHSLCYGCFSMKILFTTSKCVPECRGCFLAQPCILFILLSKQSKCALCLRTGAMWTPAWYYSSPS